MPTKIFVNSNLLRQPQLFDQLCTLPADVKPKRGIKLHGQEGRLARDLVLYAAWNGAPLVRVHVPEFCKMFGYDRALLLRKATPAQKAKMLELGLGEWRLPFYSCFLGYVLVRMAKHSFLWNERNSKSLDTSLRSHQLVTEIDCRVRKQGTYAEFTISASMVGQNRARFQPLHLEDYLALVTEKGYAWEAGRKLYMRLAWKRAWWDWLEKSGTLKAGDTPSHDTYPDLVGAASLDNIKPLRNQASKLLAMLREVAEQPSVCMVPTMHNIKGKYYVTWRRYELHTVGGPPKHELYPIEPAPATWGKDPNPPSTVATDEHEEFISTSWKPEPGEPVASPPPAPAPQPALRVAKQLTGYDRRRMENDLDDTLRGWRWMKTDDGRATYPSAEAYRVALGNYEEKIMQLRRELGILEPVL